MIQVTRLIGESFDFVNHREIRRSIVLSNGHSERIVEVQESVVKAVLELYAQAGEAAATAEVPVTNGAKAKTPEEKQMNFSSFVADHDAGPGEEYVDETGALSI